MFYLLQFDNIESEETQKLKNALSDFPNGTILSYAVNMKVSILPKDKWIVWIDKDGVYEYSKQYEDFLKIPGIKSFIELVEITKTVRDSDWEWNDDYINNIFANYI